MADTRWVSVAHKNIGDMFSHEEFNEILDSVQGLGNPVAIDTYGLHVKSNTAKKSTPPAVGNMIVDNTIIANDYKGNGTTTLNTLTVQGQGVFDITAKFKQNIECVGQVHAGANLATDANVIAKGYTEIQGKNALGNGLLVKEKSRFYKDVVIKHDENTPGTSLTNTQVENVTALDTTVEKFTANKDAVFNGLVTVGKSLTVDKNTTIKGTLVVSNEAGTAGAAIDAGTNSISGGSLSITGNSSTGTLTVADKTTTKSLLVHSNAVTYTTPIDPGCEVIEKNLAVGNNITVGNNLTVTKETLTDSLQVTASTVTNTLTVADSSTTNTLTVVETGTLKNADVTETITCKDISVTDTGTFAKVETKNLDASVKTVTKALEVTEAATIGTDLTVTNKTTTKSLSVTDTGTLKNIESTDVISENFYIGTTKDLTLQESIEKTYLGEKDSNKYVIQWKTGTNNIGTTNLAIGATNSNKTATIKLDSMQDVIKDIYNKLFDLNKLVMTKT